MGKFSRRSFLKSRIPAANRGVLAVGTPDGPALDGTSRRSFLQGSAGAAAGAAAILATPKIASLGLDGAGSSVPVEQKPVVVKPSGSVPPEPVAAYVRNAESGEVTVMSGTRETTYRDPALAKRLLDAAK